MLSISAGKRSIPTPTKKERLGPDKARAVFGRLSHDYCRQTAFIHLELLATPRLQPENLGPTVGPLVGGPYAAILFKKRVYPLSLNLPSRLFNLKVSHLSCRIKHRPCHVVYISLHVYKHLMSYVNLEKEHVYVSDFRVQGLRRWSGQN